ncbi:MAG: DUF6378 domain-containing protein [Candidatus Nanopelagicaceae bacterium]
MNRIEILQEALRLTSKDRLETHGTPYLNHRRIADLWSAYLETPITPEQVAICQALVKVARSQKSSIDDHYIDGAAYFAIAGELAAIEERQGE